jgi:hypothetical protein
MGYVTAMGSCWSCGSIFCFNPHRVPSFPVNGVRMPICLNCMTIANAKRKEAGVEPHPIHPDAYEAIGEDEL